MALLAALVIFTVIARYCFSLSWKQLAEFNTTLFAFTTFWGMGINVIKDEHVMIDILYDGVKPARKRWLAIINYLIVLAVVLVFTYQGFKYVGVAGKQISQGMEIPMMYIDLYIELDARISFGEFLRNTRELDLELSDIQKEDHSHYDAEVVPFTVTIRSKTSRTQDDILSIIRRMEGIKYFEVI